MSIWSNKFRRDDRGTSVLEFGLIVPMFLLVTVGFIEFGRAEYQTNAIEKATRAGALYIARHPLPLNYSVFHEARNLVKTGTTDGSGQYLVSGWSLPDAHVYFDIENFNTGDGSIPVVKVIASVPFDPLLPGLPAALGLGSFVMKARHEQAYVGD